MTPLDSAGLTSVQLVTGILLGYLDPRIVLTFHFTWLSVVSLGQLEVLVFSGLKTVQLNRSFIIHLLVIQVIRSVVLLIIVVDCTLLHA